MKKNIALLSICLLAAFVLAGSASAVTISLNGGSTIALGQGNVVISGTCNGSTLNVPLVLTQGGKSIQLAVATTPDNGPSNAYVGFANFPLNVDDGFVTGSATLTAVCPEGNASVDITLVDPDPAVVPLGTSLNFSGNSTLNSNFGISGVCGTNPAGSNVSFTVTQNGITTNLGSTTTVGTGGNFSANFNLGSGFVAGPAIITATCPGTGNVITSAVNFVDPNATNNTNNNNTGTGTGTTNNTNTGSTTGTTSGASTTTGSVSTTPVGGVAAGGGISILTWSAVLFMILGAGGLAYAHRKELSLE
jgi:hypothetical protein